MKQSKKIDSQSRKYQLTINNPDAKGVTHAVIHAAIQNHLKSTIYYCMADEQGAEGTLHTHLFIACGSPVRFSTIKNLFPTAHIEKAMGSCEDNRNYIMKSGKWAASKGHTSIPDTFEEVGQILRENSRSTNGGIMNTIYEMVKAGATDIEILEVYPSAMLYMEKIQRVRQTLAAEKYAREFRPLTVTYIWGRTGTGKTRSIMEQYGYDAVCRITDYDHPFERYNGEDVLLFDEFRSQLRISDMLNYLDGYPIMLPCRYANRQARYTKVFLISNVELKQQYRNIQFEEPYTWAAFLRRIHSVVEYTAEGCNAEPVVVQDMLPEFTELEDVDDSELPF